MTTHKLDTYYDRMTSSLGDKEKVLPFIQGERVLDVGTGSGDLLHLLLEAGYDAWGVDPSLESLDRVDDHERVKSGYADELVELFGPNSFDTVICSSVLHEVFSYGNRTGERGKMRSIASTLHAIRDVLVPGGRLIIRDGVAPEGRDRVEMWVDDPTAVDLFITSSPFTREGLDRYISLHHVDGHRFSGTPASIMEFAFTYTWGDESFDREVLEYYGLFRLKDYSKYVSCFDFTPISQFSYTQTGYMEHLRNKVLMYMPFPATNAVWVFEKDKLND